MKKLQDQLLQDLSNLIHHLERYEEYNWSGFFKKAYYLIDNGDTRGIDALKKMPRGGMGSFIDLIICVENKHKIKKVEESFANKELMRLGSEVMASTDSLYKKLREEKIL